MPSTFRLLNLPLELQHDVFSHYYKPVTLRGAKNCAGGVSWFGSSNISLLLTNKHVFREALAFYRASFNSLDVSALNDSRCKRWLTTPERQWLLSNITEAAEKLDLSSSFRSFILDQHLPILHKITFVQGLCGRFLCNKITDAEIARAWDFHDNYIHLRADSLGPILPAQLTQLTQLIEAEVVIRISVWEKEATEGTDFVSYSQIRNVTIRS